MTLDMRVVSATTTATTTNTTATTTTTIVRLIVQFAARVRDFFELVFPTLGH
jgi:hypothetical protein